MLEAYYNEGCYRGRMRRGRQGCLAGPVFAAAVILPPDFKSELLNDSKQLSEKNRYALRPLIEQEAIAWGSRVVTAPRLMPSIFWKPLSLPCTGPSNSSRSNPQALLIDGNRSLLTKRSPLPAWWRETVAFCPSPPHPFWRRPTATTICCSWRRTVLRAGNK